MLAIVRGLTGIDFVGFDVVEVIPAYDPAGQTATLAANLAYEMLSLVALRRRAERLTASDGSTPGLATRCRRASAGRPASAPPPASPSTSTPRAPILVRPSRGRRLARRDDATRPTGRGRRSRACCACSTGRRPGDVLRPRLHRRALAGRPSASIRDAGHEIAHHGYLHEGARSAPDEATEERRLLRGLEALDAVAGVRPIGYRAPNWELSYALPALLASHGFRYDSGLMDADHPYRLAVAPSRARRPSSSCPATGASTTGSRTTTCRASPARASSPAPPTSSPAGPLELEALVEEGGLFMLTNHPFVSGRASRAAAWSGSSPARRRSTGCGSRPAPRSPPHVETLPTSSRSSIGRAGPAARLTPGRGRGCHRARLLRRTDGLRRAAARGAPRTSR